MKKHSILLLLLIAFYGCSNEKSSSGYTATEEIMDPDSLATEKIIKTADMKFRVKNVQQTKERLSEAIKAEKGTLASFGIQSQVQQSEKVSYSADSLLELTSYRTEGSITASIPTDKLDEFTNKVAKMAIFVDQQSMAMDDQSITYLANKLKNQNRTEAVQQLNKNASKNNNTVRTTVDLKDSAIDNKINNMLIDNKVNYSIITLDFYQDNTVQKLVVGNDRLQDYRPNFFIRLWLNLQNGWVIFIEVILGIAHLWMVILILLIGYLAYKHFRKVRTTPLL
jgi:hypothetical protein